MAKQTEFVVIGGGIAGLTAACLLTEAGFSTTVLEQNWLPGGCASSYPRKHYIFESGATTLVGLEPGMPLQYVVDQLGIDIPAIQLEIPMKVYLPNGNILTRYQDLDQWIAEAERVFGPEGQRPFWEYCYKVSQFVWDTSIKQRTFPPTSWRDLLPTIKHFQPRQLAFAPLALKSMKQLLKDYGLDQHSAFVSFINEQLLITAQNHIDEVNVLFGATALCYTQYANYYVPGGLINLVKPMVDYLESHGSQVILREGVQHISKTNGIYHIRTKKSAYQAPHIISAIPINDTLSIWEGEALERRYQRKLLDSSALNSAFSVGLVFKKHQRFDCLHHQIHLPEPLPYSGSHSIFLSLSHPDDQARCGTDEVVGSISTHVPDPDETIIEDKELVCEYIFKQLESHGFLAREDIIFYHASTPKAWKKWTGRSWGFVGGYPQYMKIKPWQMLDARLDGKGAYICGDSTYPGQGIPGACLSGIIAVEKMKVDGVLKKR